MKTLILYASTYGYTQECAAKLSNDLLGDVLLVNINADPVPPLEEYDTVLIGGSIYMGQIQKKIKEYCLANADSLKKKNLGFFISCGSAENFDENIKNSFPEALINAALSIENFGGEFRIDKMKLSHKLIMKMVAKATEKDNKPPAKPMPENIKKMAQTINHLNV
ncbi:flavodoxin [Acetobacterium paludosum]|uniref:Flavodoxin n=1 Tax=Acetobacterium paludosum TaxID=52693 RepID=A0A923I1K3_9FIRM|nr:flavodoxin domain-containing protein [Acetobacterium paludosum]MBC3890006.1 flavodoxin [Acetobacterium paludosum]